MRFLIFILFLLPATLLAQKKDYKNYDKAAKYFQLGKIEKAKTIAFKVLDKNPSWSKPNLLLASIFAEEENIEESANYLLNVYDENNPNDALGIEQVGLLYYKNGYYANALHYFKAAEAQNKEVLGSKTNLYIENCAFALDNINNPVDFNPTNLGENINTAAEEYLPAISVDGQILMITRRVEGDRTINGKIISQEDFYISEKDNNGNWTPAKAMAINTPLNEGAITISSDGDALVYTACNRDNGLGSCDLYISIKRNGSYSAGVNIGRAVNSKKWESQACFSPDGKYLYFVSNRQGGYGGKDIWRSEITEKGFKTPENLGDTINTKYNEMSPFMHPDNLTFYFSSDGHRGFGDYDLFVSRRKNTTEQWGMPQNMGYPINTYNTENSLIVASDGKTAYYASNKSGYGMEDIFKFDLPKQLQAEPLAEIEIDIITKRTGEEVVLKNVSFASNSFALEQNSYDELNKLADYLKKNPNISIEVQGHTDNIGSSTDNQVLSEKRAKVVYDYLSAKVSNTLSYKGYGESQPISTDNKLNRRTSFVIKAQN